MALLDRISKSAIHLMEDGVGSRLGKGILKAAGSKKALGILTAGAVVKGLSDTVGKSAIDNAMDIAFDNPEADRAVLGTDLKPSMLVAQAGLGPISDVARNMNISKYGYNPGANAAIGSIGMGAMLGGTAGAVLGSKGGVKGAIIGGIAGNLLGGISGLAVAASPTLSYAKNNRQLLSQSPFSNSSLMTADSLNASGDIVFGMHNTRRG